MSLRTKRIVLVSLAATGVLVLAGALSLWTTAADTVPRTVNDKAFITAANDICEEHLRPLESGRPDRDEPLSNDETATRVEETVERMKILRSKLDSVPVQVSDRAEVQRWLRDWKSYTEAGRAYAKALRSNDKDDWRAVGSEGDVYARDLFAFAHANDLDSCVMRSTIETSRRSSPF